MDIFLPNEIEFCFESEVFVNPLEKCTGDSQLSIVIVCHIANGHPSTHSFENKRSHGDSRNAIPLHGQGISFDAREKFPLVG